MDDDGSQAEISPGDKGGPRILIHNNIIICGEAHCAAGWM
jgi:hypothetical protein